MIIIIMFNRRSYRSLALISDFPRVLVLVFYGGRLGGGLIHFEIYLLFLKSYFFKPILQRRRSRMIDIAIDGVIKS